MDAAAQWLGIVATFMIGIGCDYAYHATWDGHTNAITFLISHGWRQELQLPSTSIAAAQVQCRTNVGCCACTVDGDRLLTPAVAEHDVMRKCVNYYRGSNGPAGET